MTGSNKTTHLVPFAPERRQSTTVVTPTAKGTTAGMSLKTTIIDALLQTDEEGRTPRPLSPPQRLQQQKASVQTYPRCPRRQWQSQRKLPPLRRHHIAEDRPLVLRDEDDNEEDDDDVDVATANVCSLHVRTNTAACVGVIHFGAEIRSTSCVSARWESRSTTRPYTSRIPRMKCFICCWRLQSSKALAEEGAHLLLNPSLGVWYVLGGSMPAGARIIAEIRVAHSKPSTNYMHCGKLNIIVAFSIWHQKCVLPQW